MPSPQRAPLVALSPFTQATLTLAQPRPQSSVDIPSLRAQLNSLDIVLSTLLDQRLAVSARLTEAVALSSPIRLVSAEILAEIFIISTIPSDSPQDAPALLSTLMLVCKHWRDICFGTPDLWTRISISPTEPDSLEKARRRLSRSKTLPLDIYLDFSPRSSFSTQAQLPASTSHRHIHFITPDHLLKTTLLLLSPTVSRWRTFVLLIPYHPQATAALALLSSPAPMLECLTVQVSNPMIHVSTSEWDGGRKSLPFAGVMPKLKECSLTSFWCGCPEELIKSSRMSSISPGTLTIPRGCDLPRSAPGLSSAMVDTRLRTAFLGAGPTLTKLRLVGFWNESAPGVEDMVAMLQQCPLLEDLSLRNMTDVDPAEVQFNTPATTHVILSRLRHLSFYYSGVTRTCAFFHRTFLPGLEQLELSFLDNITGCLKHLKHQTFLCPDRSPRGHRDDYDQVCANTRPLEHGEVARFSLKSLRIEASLFNELKLMRLLRRLHTLKTLELVDLEDVSSNLLRGLSVPLQPKEWILPHLEVLNLEGCTTVEWDALKALIESRLPSSSASSSAAAALHHYRSSSSSSHGFIPGLATVSSASEYARGQAMAETPYVPTQRILSPHDSPISAPRKIIKLDLTRCNQISRERIQWLKMYVPEVVCESAKGGWTGLDGM